MAKTQQCITEQIVLILYSSTHRRCHYFLFILTVFFFACQTIRNWLAVFALFLMLFCMCDDDWATTNSNSKRMHGTYAAYPHTWQRECIYQAPLQSGKGARPRPICRTTPRAQTHICFGFRWPQFQQFRHSRICIISFILDFYLCRKDIYATQKKRGNAREARVGMCWLRVSRWESADEKRHADMSGNVVTMRVAMIEGKAIEAFWSNSYSTMYKTRRNFRSGFFFVLKLCVERLCIVWSHEMGGGGLERRYAHMCQAKIPLPSVSIYWMLLVYNIVNANELQIWIKIYSVISFALVDLNFSVCIFSEEILSSLHLFFVTSIAIIFIPLRLENLPTEPQFTEILCSAL